MTLSEDEGLYSTQPLFPHVYAWETLLSAWDRVESNDGASGTDHVTLDEFELRLEEHLKELQRDLRDRLYQPQPLLRVFRPKPSGGLRPLVIPTVRDRVAQTAVALVITPMVDCEFEPVSFGYRHGRSVAQAVAEVEKCYENGYRWIVDADIDNFFDEVDHNALLTRFAGSVHDADIVQLVSAWIKTPIQHENETVQPVRGLPQGLPVSPVLANLYLDEFDKALLQRGLKLVRFADDFLILCKEQPNAEAALQVSEALLRDLHLTLDPDKTRVASFDQGFRYLGHLFVRGLVLPSPNRLQKRRLRPVGPPAPVQPQAPPATSPQHFPPSLGTSHAAGHAPLLDTPVSRALSQALQAAGMNSLFQAEPAAPQPSVPDPLGLPPLASVVSPGAHLESTQARPASSASSFSGNSDLPASTTDIAPGPSEAVMEPPSPPASSAPSASRQPYSPFRRTLYIQEQGSLLARQDERLLVKKDDEILLEVPAAKVDQVFVFGRCAITTPAMTFCLEHQIPIVLMSSRGKYYGLVDSPVGDRVSLHRLQFERAADAAFCLAIAKSIVQGKIANSRVLLQRHQRRKDVGQVAKVIDDLQKLAAQVKQGHTLEEVFGYEGQAASRYFEAFGYLLNFTMGFGRRVKHPPTDPVNSLLSFGYALAFYNLYALIRARGLHPYVGHLHAMRDWHPALASDMVEEFRAPIVDSLVLYLVNSKIIIESDFYRLNDAEHPGACYLQDPARKTYLKHFEQKMASPVVHPGTGESVDWRRAMDLQVAHMLQRIRGEVNAYVPMEIR